MQREEIEKKMDASLRLREEADILEVERKMQAVVVKLQYHITREQSGLEFEKLAEENRKKLAGA